MLRKLKKHPKSAENDLNQALITECNEASSLHDAVIADQPDTIVKMLGKGTNIDARDLNGATALHLAVINQNVAIVKLLIENGADVNARVYEVCKERYHQNYRYPIAGCTPLQLSIVQDYKNMSIATMLIDCETIDFSVKLFTNYSKPKSTIAYFIKHREFQLLERIEKKLRQKNNALMNAHEKDEEMNIQPRTSMTLFRNK